MKPEISSKTQSADEDDEILSQLGTCKHVYQQLEDCLAETNRNWQQCQQYVKALKECHDTKSKK